MSRWVDSDYDSFYDSNGSLIDLSVDRNTSSSSGESNESTNSEISSTSTSETDGFLVSKKNYYYWSKHYTDPSEDSFEYDDDELEEYHCCDYSEEAISDERTWKRQMYFACLGSFMFTVFVFCLPFFFIKVKYFPEESMKIITNDTTLTTIHHFGEQRDFDFQENEIVECSLFSKIDVNSIVSESGLYNFGVPEYECTGFCYCSPYDQHRRSTSAAALTKKSLTFVITALTTLMISKNAKKYLHNNCETFMNKECPSSSIQSEVGECKQKQEQQQEQQKESEMNNNSLFKSIKAILFELERTCEEKSSSMNIKTVLELVLERDSKLSDGKKKMIAEAVLKSVSSSMSSTKDDTSQKNSIDNNYMLVNVECLCEFNRLKPSYIGYDVVEEKQVKCSSCVHIKDFKDLKIGVLEQQDGSSQAWIKLFQKCVFHKKKTRKLRGKSIHLDMKDFKFTMDSSYSKCSSSILLDECGIYKRK